MTTSPSSVPSPLLDAQALTINHRRTNHDHPYTFLGKGENIVIDHHSRFLF